MREEIRKLLVASLPELGSRVYEPYVPTLDIPKPYLVVKEGTQDIPNDWAGYTTTFEVWIFEKFETFQNVDAFRDKIVAVLDNAKIVAGGKKYLIRYLSTVGDDFWDEELQALERGLVFQVFSLGWLNGETYAPDPVDALKEWTKKTWTMQDEEGNTIPVLQVEPDSWDPSDARPGLYWRIENFSVNNNVSSAMYWLTFNIVGHLVAADPSVRRTWLRTVAERFGDVRRIPVNTETELVIIGFSVVMDRDPLTIGQISVQAEMGMLRGKEVQPILDKVEVSGDVTFRIAKEV